MNLSGQEERAGKTQIVPCNYVTTDLADTLFKEKKNSSNTGLQDHWETEGTFGDNLVQFPTQASLAGTGCPGPYPVEF